MFPLQKGNALKVAFMNWYPQIDFPNIFVMETRLKKINHFFQSDEI